MDGIADSLCVGQRISGGDERVILFLKMAPGHAFSQDIVKKVKVLLRTRLSARHVPAVVLETTDIPVSVYNNYVESHNTPLSFSDLMWEEFSNEICLFPFHETVFMYVHVYRSMIMCMSHFVRYLIHTHTHIHTVHDQC